MRFTARGGYVLALSLAAACSGEDEPPPPPPVLVTLSGMSVRLEPRPLRLVVSGRDGRVLFDGLPPRAVAPQTEEEDPPALTGFAVRDVTTEVEASFGSFQFTDRGHGWRVATRADGVVGTPDELSFDAANGDGVVAHVAVRAAADGEIAIAVRPSRPPVAGARAWTSLGARCAADEHVLGFGAQARDVDHRGTVVPLVVGEPGIGKRDDDANIPLFYLKGARHASSFPAPIYLSKRGYVGALDGPGRAVFGVCAEEDVLRIAQDTTSSPDATFVFRIFDGPTPHDALGRSTARFGRPRLPPRLAFAPWTDAIMGTEKVRAFGTFLREKDIPASAIWSEDFRGGKMNGDDYAIANGWDVDPALYPDFVGLVAELRAKGLAMFTYFSTFLSQGESVTNEAASLGFAVKRADGSDYTFTGADFTPTGLVDLTQPAARQWMAGKVKANLALGAAGFMGDFAEWLPFDARLGDGSDPFATHDLYPRLWQETQRMALDAPDVGGAAPPPGERLSFVRSGWLGSAPLADVVWAGDQSTDFKLDDGLPTIVPMGLGLGIAGISTYGHDIAGYQVALTVPSTKELFFRWTELGAWSPVMRTHHGTQPLKNWSLDRDAETTAHFRRYAILHQQLLPVWEKLATEASETGIPIWRHLALEVPDDVVAWQTGNELMVGSSILVAPVDAAGVSSRPVYLPAGDWVPWEPGPVLAGGVHEVAAGVTEIPVFVRRGSLLAMLPDTVRTVLPSAVGVTRVEDAGDDRVLFVALGPDASFVERGGLRYALTNANGRDAAAFAAATWNGAALAACPATPAPPCVLASASRTKAFVTGPGVLEGAGGARVVVEGGAATRALVVDLR